MPGILLATAGVPYGPSVTFRTQGILPPSALYVAPSDALVLQFRAPGFSIQTMLTVRILTPEGEVKELQQAFTLSTANFAVGTASLLPTEGFILSAHLSAVNAARGQCFVKLFLQRSPGSTDQTLGALLFQGYVSGDDHLSYPQSPTESSLSQQGFIQTVTVPNPPVGQFFFTFTMPNGFRSMLHSLTFRFTTSAVNVQRTLFFVVSIPGSNQNFYAGSWPGAVGPGTFQHFTMGQGIGSSNNHEVEAASLPVGWKWPEIATLSVNIDNVDAGDQVSNIVALIESWVSQ